MARRQQPPEEKLLKLPQLWNCILSELHSMVIAIIVDGYSTGGTRDNEIVQ